MSICSKVFISCIQKASGLSAHWLNPCSVELPTAIKQSKFFMKQFCVPNTLVRNMEKKNKESRSFLYRVVVRTHFYCSYQFIDFSGYGVCQIQKEHWIPLIWGSNMLALVLQNLPLLSKEDTPNGSWHSVDWA